MKELLLPYAYDSTGELVYIEDAQKNETYTCPECGCVLTYVTSKIPEGQKYHRRNHFSHPNGGSQCSESFLHKLFKERAAECISKKISEGKEEFWFTWQCNQCAEEHCGNMLKKAKQVRLEYDLKICKPDIALLDADGKVVIVIEIVVTHKPTSEVIDFYNTHKIACLQICISDFEDCENVEKKLIRPDYVNLCPTPYCEKCGHKMRRARMIIGDELCWNCGKITKVAIIKDSSRRMTYSPIDFTEEEVASANKHGANVQKRLFRKEFETLNTNTCEHCGMSGKRFLHNDYLPKVIKELDLYKCFRCIEITEREKKANVTGIKNRKTNVIAEGKICPKCQCELVVKQSSYGTFYACGNYPNCKYTESSD